MEADHLPMWVELAINHAEEYLRYLRIWTSKTPRWFDGTGGDAPKNRVTNQETRTRA